MRSESARTQRLRKFLKQYFIDNEEYSNVGYSKEYLLSQANEEDLFVDWKELWNIMNKDNRKFRDGFYSKHKKLQDSGVFHSRKDLIDDYQYILEKACKNNMIPAYLGICGSETDVYTIPITFEEFEDMLKIKADKESTDILNVFKSQVVAGTQLADGSEARHKLKDFTKVRKLMKGD